MQLYRPGRRVGALLRIAGWLFVAGIVLLCYMYLETRWLKVSRVTIESADIPAAFDGKRIVFVSDVHHGKYLSRARVKSLVEKINAEHPDLILMGGDYSYTNSNYIRSFFELFSEAHSKWGRFGVIGNHDNFVDGALTREMMRETGVYICDNRSYWIRYRGARIKIGGVGDLENEQQLPEKTIGDVRKKDFCILLVHQPAYIQRLTTDKVDLTLSGHTHGGQVTLFGLWAPILPTPNGLFSWPNSVDQRYHYGLVKDGERQSYITSGVGTRFPPLRFFCRPEFVVLTLRAKSLPKPVR